MRRLSKNGNSTSIVVDKFSKKCIVYKSGKKYKEFEVELGMNWLGDKKHRGDKATPEGKYSIVAKKSGNKTIYHKALLINFPNEEDKRQFASEKAKGNIPRSYNIGGSIEVHGGGGKGIDWTEGCVALHNKDMDQLYSLCSVGTPIAIVGSLVPLDEIFEK
jgi:murein L,D-transpeptidase YafK